MSAGIDISPVPAVPQWAAEPDAASFSGQGEAWAQLRRKGYTAFSRHGFPTTRREAWRNTSLSHLEEIDFQLAGGPHNISPAQIEPYLLPDGPVAVLIDGIFSAELSATGGLPAGMTLGSLATGLQAGSESLLAQLDGEEALDEVPFSALNLAHLRDGVWLDLQAGTQFDGVAQILIISTGRQATVSFPRLLITAGENSQLTILERYIHLGEPPSLTVPVTDILCGPSAVVEHLRLHDAKGTGDHIGSVRAVLRRDSHLRSVDISTGRKLIRNDVLGRLAEAGAALEMSGLYLVDGSGHVDNHTRLDHIAPHTSSTQNYKGILTDSARGVFTGRVVVHPEAQKTLARQTNRNLMLSDKARVHTDPQLEIFADDVKCSHGSTVGQIDRDALFYFRTRGIDEETARRLLIHGFTSEVVATLRSKALREIAEMAVEGWLETAGIA